jgi:hypothetical protein
MFQQIGVFTYFVDIGIYFINPLNAFTSHIRNFFM